VKILLRADSGFARDELMAWCEANGVDYVFGLARNERLVGAIAGDLGGAGEFGSGRPGAPLRRLPLAHAGQLAPRAPGGRQGRAFSQGLEPALCRHLCSPIALPR